VEVYTDCGGELVGELFWFETIGGNMWYLPYSIQDDNHNYNRDYQFLWTKILFV
jgi:hypothetical protein